MQKQRNVEYRLAKSYCQPYGLDVEARIFLTGWEYIDREEDRRSIPMAITQIDPCVW